MTTIADIQLWWHSLDGEWKRLFQDNISLDGFPNDKQLIQIFNLKTLFMNVPNEYEEDLEPYHIENLQPLAFLSKLEDITIQGEVEGITSLDPLKGCIKLKHLGINGTSVSDLRPIRNLINLTTIDLSFTDVVDIGPLAGLKNLVSIRAIESRISSLLPLFMLPQLESIDIWGGTVTDDMIESFSNERPNCVINRLKHDFAEIEAFNSGNQDITSFADNERWTYENAPLDIKQEMDDIYNFLVFGLEDIWAERLGCEDQTNVRLNFPIDEEDYFIIADYIGGELQPALISNSRWSYWT